MLAIGEKIQNELDTKIVRPQIIIDIDGIDLIYARYPTDNNDLSDGFEYDENNILDYTSQDKSARAILDIKNTTTTINHQLMSDKSGSGSSSNFKIALIDVNEYATKIITPYQIVDDILARKVKCYITFNDLSSVNDAILFYTGIVEGVEISSGRVELNLAAPEYLKRNTLFPKFSTELVLPLNSSDTNFSAKDLSLFPAATGSGMLTFYLKIDEEVMSYGSHSTTNFNTVTRGLFGTAATTHDADAPIEILYRVQGQMSDLALSIMLSTPADQEQFGNTFSNNRYSGGAYPNSIAFLGKDCRKDLGLVLGDFVTLTASAGNDGTYAITSINYDSATSINYLGVGSSLVTESGLAFISFKSKYNTLGDYGLNMTPEQVDVARHEEIAVSDSVGFFDYDFLIDEAINGNDFINTQLYFPNGCYQIPRETKASIGTTRAPILQFGYKQISISNIISPSKIKINRSISKDFYNAIIYRYDKFASDGRYLSGRLNISASSTERIKISNKPLTVTSDGIKSGAGVTSRIDKRSERLLDRYQFGAESLSVQILFTYGFNIEIGDIVTFNGENLSLSDTKTGNRNFSSRIMEVTNKSMNLANGLVTLVLTDTSYSLNGRYGTIAPASQMPISGHTASLLQLTDSYSTLVNSGSESSKWSDYIGQELLVYNTDYSVSSICILEAISGTNQISVSGLASAPSGSGLKVRLADYATSAASRNSLSKSFHCYANKQDQIVTIAASNKFNVANGSLYRKGVPVYFHNEDYSLKSGEFTVTNVSLNEVTINKDIDYAWAIGHNVELIGYSDGGLPYRLS